MAKLELPERRTSRRPSLFGEASEEMPQETLSRQSARQPADSRPSSATARVPRPTANTADTANTAAIRAGSSPRRRSANRTAAPVARTGTQPRMQTSAQQRVGAQTARSRTQTATQPRVQPRTQTAAQPRVQPRTQTAAQTRVQSRPVSSAVKTEQKPRLKIPYKRIFRRLLRRLALFAVMFAVLFLIAGAITLLRVYTGNKPADVKYSYQIGTDEAKISASQVASSRLFRQGTLYLNLTDLASYCELTTAGDVNSVRFISRTSENESVRFVPNIPVIYVNNVPVRLSAPVYAEEENLWVPAEFFENYVNGVTLTVDTSKHEICFAREILTPGDKTQAPVYRAISFTVKEALPTANITEESLGKELLYETDPERIAAEQEMQRIREAEAAQKAAEESQNAAAQN